MDFIKKWIDRHTGRREKFKKIAQELGMNFSTKDEWGTLSLLKDFQLYHSGRITNILEKKAGFYESNIQIFDYHYSTGSGDSETNYDQTVFFIQSKKLSLPEFYLTPEFFLHRIGRHLGIDDIDFQEHPTFSKEYWLKGEDEDRIRTEMSDSVLRFFTIEKDWHLEGNNYFMILYKKDVLMLPEEIKELYQKGEEVAALFVNT